MSTDKRSDRSERPEILDDDVMASKDAGQAIPGSIKRNDDGSITIGDSELAQIAVSKPQRWTGVNLRPDPRYNSKLVAKFINCLMYDGKKSTAEAVVYDAFTKIADKLRIDPLGVFEQALENAKPKVEVRSKRVGGANYQVPVEVKSNRQQTLAIRWILEAVRGRRGRPTAEKLAQELMDCYNKTGTTIQKREGVHRMAEANKAFSHFA